ncbi:MAG TPA: RNA polymerase sigma factor [Povalibacter sp.]
MLEFLRPALVIGPKTQHGEAKAECDGDDRNPEYIHDQILQEALLHAFETRQEQIRLQAAALQPPGPRRSIKVVQPAVNMNIEPGIPPKAPKQTAAMERDADLLAALKAGDRRAVLEGLMDRYRQKVMHLAVSIVRDPVLAEDLAQTTFVKVWQALPKFDGRAALSTWLYTIARNTCLTAVERERRIVPLEDFAEVADDDGDPMVFGTAQAGVETAGQASAEYDVAKLLEQLPEPYRRVVVLFYLEDRTCEEVGELLSMPTGTVKALLHRGRKKLAALAGELETES